MEQILILVVYGLPKETVTAIMMLNENTKVKVRSPDEDTDFFDIVGVILQWDTLAPLYVHNLPYLYSSKIDRSNERK